MKWAEARGLDTAEKRWPRTLYAVEGDSFAAWEHFQKHRPGWTWEQCHGWGFTLDRVAIMKLPVGRIERMPVCVSVTWDLIAGELVAFYEATSQVVDHRIVDKYIRKNCKRVTNMSNLHNVIHAIEATQAPGSAKERP